MSRTTLKQLESKVEYLNELTNNSKDYWNDGVINIGHYTLSGAYGGYELQQISTSGGGVSLPLYTGHISKPKLYDMLCALIKGIEIGKSI